ncbi:hypothetical protein CXB51_022742 [Gossypium anomalum]|uniref:Uncharacterized protein n=1 Tax=Gossypium anomalum TaxID=47600 RepID=A0A8J6CY27_9ROSI|nr:hypothetical protein CXB51_022742 [Gossypium anomalum]
MWARLQSPGGGNSPFQPTTTTATLVAVVAGLMEEYTVLLARLIEQMLHEAPFPRRMRFLILRSLPFVYSTPLLIQSPT